MASQPAPGGSQLGLGGSGLSGPLGLAGEGMSVAAFNPSAVDMDIDVDEGLSFEHDMPQEKVDADFFNDFDDDLDDEDLA